MGKTKTSQKPEKLQPPLVSPRKVSSEGMAKVKALASHDPTEKLADPDFMVKALVECLFEGDEAAFKEILKDHFEAVNTTKALKRAKLSQRTFFEAVSKKGNPSLRTILKMIGAITSELKETGVNSVATLVRSVG